MARARFITLEGGEGSGKSSQSPLLAAWLRAQGHDVIETREPGGTPGAEEIRSLLVQGEAGRWTPMTEALLHFAARRDHVAKVIRPALARGAWVVSDRFPIRRWPIRVMGIIWAGRRSSCCASSCWMISRRG
jgi:dTMP kinase